MITIKGRAVEVIQRMPEDKMLYALHILQALEAMPADKERGRQKAREALADILNMPKRLPEDFNPEEELQEAGMEKYGYHGSHEYCIGRSDGSGTVRHQWIKLL